MIRNSISERVHQVVLAKVVHRQFNSSNDHRSLSCGTHSSPQASHALVPVDLVEGSEEVFVWSTSIALAIRPVHLHAHLQHVRGIGYRRGNTACYSCTQNIHRNSFLASGLVLQEAIVIRHLLQRVVGAELDRTIRGLAQHSW